MLKITDANRSLILEGRLVGAWVAELARIVEETSPHTLDLRAVGFADRDGVRLLRAIRDDGVELVGASGFVAALLDAPHGPVG